MIGKNIQEIESFLQKIIFPELEKGRPNWDKPHTIAVVHYLKEIFKNTPDLTVDFPVLLIASYAHDWGYSGLFHEGKVIKLTDIIAVKKLHMEIGAKKIAKLLTDPFFSILHAQQKKRIVHLVKMHDRLIELRDTDERILVEADTLGGLDTDYIKPFSDKESGDRYISGVEKKRIPLFITEYGKMKVRELIEKRKQHYETLL